jgi:hypothetical protein
VAVVLVGVALVQSAAPGTRAEDELPSVGGPAALDTLTES